MNLKINLSKKKYDKYMTINWFLFMLIVMTSYFVLKEYLAIIIGISSVVYISFTFYILKNIKYYPISIKIEEDKIEIVYIKQNMKKYTGILSNIQLIEEKDGLIFKEKNNVIAIIKDSNISHENKDNIKKIFLV